MEDIREVAWKGDLTTLRHLVEYLKLDVNQPHAINGTTPLHWAVKGGYVNVVSYLLSQGADPKLADKAGVSSIDLAEKASNSVRAAFGLPAVEREPVSKSKDAHVTTAFVPLPSATLPMPPLASPQPAAAPHSAPIVSIQTPPPGAQRPGTSPQTTFALPQFANEKLLYVKVGEESDVFEVDLPLDSFAALSQLILSDFLPYLRYEHDMSIAKIRKSPNIIVHNDRDVARLKHGDLLLVDVQIAPRHAK